MCIVDLVDADNRPVPAGVPAAKVPVTNLFNRVQPLIRYELTDMFVRVADAPGHGHLRARVRGRNDDIFHYLDGTAVHPIAIRSVIVATPEIVDHQVAQTPFGIDVSAVATGDFAVDPLDRNAASGKFRRFVPL